MGFHGLCALAVRVSVFIFDAFDWLRCEPHHHEKGTVALGACSARTVLLQVYR